MDDSFNGSDLISCSQAADSDSVPPTHVLGMAQASMVELMHDNHVRSERRAIWNELSGRWFARAFRTIADQAKGMAQGRRGVLAVTIDTTEMSRMLFDPGVAVPLISTWIAAENFNAFLLESAAFDLTTTHRWSTTLAVIDPARDVAVFLHSTPAIDDIWYSRFLVVVDTTVAVH